MSTFKADTKKLISYSNTFFILLFLVIPLRNGNDQESRPVGYFDGGVNDGAEVFEGPRGGLFYYNRNGTKQYVKKSDNIRRRKWYKNI